jgi:hypothetical protein
MNSCLTVVHRQRPSEADHGVEPRVDALRMRQPTYRCSHAIALEGPRTRPIRSPCSGLAEIPGQRIDVPVGIAGCAIDCQSGRARSARPQALNGPKARSKLVIRAKCEAHMPVPIAPGGNPAGLPRRPSAQETANAAGERRPGGTERDRGTRPIRPPRRTSRDRRGSRSGPPRWPFRPRRSAEHEFRGIRGSPISGRQEFPIRRLMPHRQGTPGACWRPAFSHCSCQ